MVGNGSVLAGKRFGEKADELEVCAGGRSDKMTEFLMCEGYM